MISLIDPIARERARIRRIVDRAETTALQRIVNVLMTPDVPEEARNVIYSNGHMFLNIFSDIMREIDCSGLSHITIQKGDRISL